MIKMTATPEGDENCTEACWGNNTVTNILHLRAFSFYNKGKI